MRKLDINCELIDLSEEKMSQIKGGKCANFALEFGGGIFPGPGHLYAHAWGHILNSSLKETSQKKKW